ARGSRDAAAPREERPSRVYDQIQNIRAAARPRQPRPPSGQSLAPTIAVVLWGALHHPLHEPAHHHPPGLAGLGTNGVPVMPEWLAERTPAPPALTFVLPGKQKVNLPGSGGDFAHAVRGLPQVCTVQGDFEARARNGVERYLWVRLIESAI